MTTSGSSRRWFGRRRHGRHEAPEAPDTIDLRAPAPAAVEDPEVVIARLERLRDAGLITNAELEAERRALLPTDERR